LYLQVNKDVYDTNDKKVAYVLSLINGGTALLWKEQLLRKMINDQGEYVFPNITALYQGLENDFKSIDDKEDALEKLTKAKQGTRSIADHNAYFMLLISRSELDSDENNTVLIKYYQKSLDPDLLTAIWNTNQKPQTIGQWMFAAQEKANQLKELQNLKKSMTSTTPTRGSEPHRRFNVFLKKKFGRKTIRNTEIDESDEPYNDEDSEAEEGEIQELDDLDLYVVDSEQPACFRCNQVGHRLQTTRQMLQLRPTRTPRQKLQKTQEGGKIPERLQEDPESRRHSQKSPNNERRRARALLWSPPRRRRGFSLGDSAEAESCTFTISINSVTFLEVTRQTIKISMDLHLPKPTTLMALIDSEKIRIMTRSHAGLIRFLIVLQLSETKWRGQEEGVHGGASTILPRRYQVAQDLNCDTEMSRHEASFQKSKSTCPQPRCAHLSLLNLLPTNKYLIY
jgi:hypothetical protein